jgi:hypothetical protein
MTKTCLWLHIAFSVGAFALLAICYVLLSRTTHPSLQDRLLLSAVTLFAAMASITGLGEMIGRRGKSESIALACSTVAAILLLMLTMFTL